MPAVTEPLTGSRIVLTHVLYCYTVIEFKCIRVPESNNTRRLQTQLGFWMMDVPHNDKAEISHEIKTSNTEHD